MRILLIEDEEILASVLLKSLTKQHYVVDVVQDGQMGWEYTQSTNYDLLLIDVGLPKLDGITLCQRLRSGGCFTPILLMTAKDGSRERIQGLDAGADDYLIKPLDLEELQARIRALIRRGDRPCTPILEVGSLRLDPSSCEVTYNNKLLELTAKEYSLLELFLRNPSRVFSRGDIIEHLWTFDDPPQEETVKSHIKYLRQKLKAAGAVDWIENVYGLGYRLNPVAGRGEKGSRG
ncbi:response regulator transcription factor, partial [Nostocales cyanobacterium LEGE 12452]|nr:response regulator transcription factor [Nostocales cyanobacterium LEGE 12452]